MDAIYLSDFLAGARGDYQNRRYGSIACFDKVVSYSTSVVVLLPNVSFGRTRKPANFGTADARKKLGLELTFLN